MNLATNAASMRDSNRKLILNLLRLEPMARADLAERTNLTRASITLIVDELISEGLVEEANIIESVALGRKRTRLVLCHNARFAFGVSLHRRRCYVGVADLYGDVTEETDFATEGCSWSQITDRIVKEISSIKARSGIPDEKILGIGISAPGPVDYIEGRILNPHNFGDWKDIPICSILTERTGYTALLERDSAARTLEERFFGAAKDSSNFMLVQIGGGVGAGVMTRDKLYRGSRGLGTEMGHMSISMDGPECSCGNRGCLEAYLNISHFLADSRFESWRELIDESGAPDAQILLDRAAGWLSAAFINAFNLYDIERILLVGSDFAGAATPLVTRINKLMENKIFIHDRMQGDVVAQGNTVGSSRTGATAMLYSTFCER